MGDHPQVCPDRSSRLSSFRLEMSFMVDHACISRRDCRVVPARHRWITRMLSFAGCLLAWVSLVGCHSATEATAPPQEKELPELRTTVTEVAKQSWPTIVRVQGSLAADEVTTVGAIVAGRVMEVQVDLGDHVDAGASLVSLAREDFELAVTQAEAQLSQARAAVGLKPGDDVNGLDPLNAPPVREARAMWDEAKQQVERQRQLHTQNASSDAQLQQAEAAERVAEARHASAINSVREKIALISVRTAELALARQHLADSVITSPFEGIIQTRLVAPGTYVQVGQPLIDLIRTSTLRFRGAMPERHAQSLRPGQRLLLQIESIAEPREVTVSRISPALDETSRALTFEATVMNPTSDLRPGLFAEADVNLDPDATSIVIPRSAVVRFAGVEKVWRVENGMAREVLVQVGREEHDQVEVLDGLSPGDTILLRGVEGKQAKVIPDKPVLANDT